jgi:hypothetical protein
MARRAGSRSRHDLTLTIARHGCRMPGDGPAHLRKVKSKPASAISLPPLTQTTSADCSTALNLKITGSPGAPYCCPQHEPIRRRASVSVALLVIVPNSRPGGVTPGQSPVADKDGQLGSREQTQNDNPGNCQRGQPNIALVRNKDALHVATFFRLRHWRHHVVRRLACWSPRPKPSMSLVRFSGTSEPAVPSASCRPGLQVCPALSVVFRQPRPRPGRRHLILTRPGQVSSQSRSPSCS